MAFCYEHKTKPPGLKIYFYLETRLKNTANQLMPWNNMASATLTKPAMLAPLM